MSTDTPTVSSTNRKSNWFLPGITLGWPTTRETAGGGDATYPVSGDCAAIGAGCSTYSVYDSLIALFGDKTKYPSLEQVNIIGHSNGAGTVLRYSVFAPQSSNGLSIRFSVANTPTFPYFTESRPWLSDSNNINNWIYGFEGGLSNYVAARMKDLPSLFMNWCSKDVRLLTGDIDTYAR